MDLACLPAAERRFTVAALAVLGQRELAGRIASGDEGAAAELDVMAQLLERR